MLTAFGAAAVTFMMLMYALERRGRGFIFAFGCGCVLSSAYGFLASTWPFGIVELIWAGVAFNRYRNTPTRLSNSHDKRLGHRLVEMVNERDFDSSDEVASGQREQGASLGRAVLSSRSRLAASLRSSRTTSPATH